MTTDPNLTRPISPIRNEERMRLYAAGFSDLRIARIQGVRKSAILQWRRARGLASSNHLKLVGATGKRRALYEAGLSDPEIAELEGVVRQAIQQWRTYYGLPTKFEKPKNLGIRMVFLDATIRDSLSQLHEKVADPACSAWLEEMGATVW